MSLYCIESKCKSQGSSRSSRSKLHSVEAAAKQEAYCTCWYLLDLNGARVKGDQAGESISALKTSCELGCISRERLWGFR